MSAPEEHLRAVLDAAPTVGPPITGEEEEEDAVAIGDALTDQLAALVESWRAAEAAR